MSAHKELWQVEAERLGGEAFAQVLGEMRDTQRSMVNSLDTLIKGFPDGDAEAHRRYHEAVIARIELRNAMVKAALIKMAQAGAVAGTGWLMVAFWRAFKISLTQ